MDDIKNIIYSAVGFGLGIYLFFSGFTKFRKKQLIEDIPTSTVRGMAMGLVELYGKAKGENLLTSPLTKTKCVLYQYKIEEYRSSGKSGHWVMVASGNSFLRPFWLDDGTGRVRVITKDAEIILPADYELEIHFGKTIPNNLIEFMQFNNISYKTWVFNKQLRFKEWFVLEDENVYVLGTAKYTKDSFYNHNEQLAMRIKELKNNAEKMKNVDLNKDNVIDQQEWDTAVAYIEHKLLEETLNSSKEENQEDVIVTRGDQEKIFIISDYSQKDLTKKLAWESIFFIGGGVAISLVSLYSCLLCFKFFSF